MARAYKNNTNEGNPELHAKIEMLMDQGLKQVTIQKLLKIKKTSAQYYWGKINVEKSKRLDPLQKAMQGFLCTATRKS